MQKAGNIKYYITTLISIGCVWFSASAQTGEPSVKVLLSNNHILIGEQIKLNVQVTTPVDKPITQWYNLPDTFNHIEVLSRSTIDSIRDGSVKTYNQTFTITAFDSGVWNIPVVEIMAGNTKTASQLSDLTVVPAQLKDSSYHDIREIINVPVEKTPWWYWVAAALSAILLGMLIWLWIKSRKGKPAIIKESKSSLSALEEAMRQLRELQMQGLPEKGEWKKYYSVLTTIFKIYAERKFPNGFLQKTTDEILVSLDPKLSRETLGETAETLRIADAVKFARYQPDIIQASLSMQLIEKTLKELDNVKQ
jgi:hypothetical protein